MSSSDGLNSTNTGVFNGDGGASGGIALGGPRTSLSGTTMDIVIIITSVVVGIALLTAFVYGCSVVLDKYCCCFPWFMPVGDHTQEFDHGPVARKAGLWGLRRNERTEILELLFPGESYTEEMANGHASPNKTDNKKTNKKSNKKKNKDAVQNKSGDIETGKPKSTPVSTGLDATNHSIIPDGEVLDVDDVEHDTTCAICLVDYEKDELIVRGKTCNHMFHKTCTFEWLQKNDHCPYCRQEMFTPENMLEKAHEVIGKERVNQMLDWAASSQARSAANPNAATNNATSGTETIALEMVTTSVSNEATTPSAPTPTPTEPVDNEPPETDVEAQHTVGVAVEEEEKEDDGSDDIHVDNDDGKEPVDDEKGETTEPDGPDEEEEQEEGAKVQPPQEQ